MGFGALVYLEMILFLILLFLIPVFFLFLPIFFSFSFQFPDTREFSLRFWKGVFCVEGAQGITRISILGWKIPAFKKKKQRPPKEASGKKAKSKAARPRLSAILESRSVWKAWGKAFLAFFKKLLHAVEIRECTGHLNVGLETPAQTGMWLGYYYAAIEFLSPLLPSQFTLTVEGDFTRNQISGTAAGRGKTSLARLIAPFIVLLLRAPLWRTYRIFA